jgi:hypothetical protein
MSLLSELYVGDKETILHYCLNLNAGISLPASVEYHLSLSTCGISNPNYLFITELDDIADWIALYKGIPSQGLKRYYSSILDGDESSESGSQVVVLDKLFACDLAALSRENIDVMVKSLEEKEAQETRDRNRIRVEVASRPIQSFMDVFTFPVVAFFAWFCTKSLLWTLVVLLLFCLFCFLLLPWVRVRKVKSRISTVREKRELGEMIHSLVDFARNAKGSSREIIYHWSL